MKTRTLAQALVAEGQVRLNRVKVTKPGHDVTIGDVLTLSAGMDVRVLRVEAIAARRGPYAQARHLYLELDAPAQKGDATGAENC